MSEKEEDGGYSSVVNVYPSRGVIEVANPKAKSENERNKIFTYDAVYSWRYGKKFVSVHVITLVNPSDFQICLC